jgi:hypothetical protein
MAKKSASINLIKIGRNETINNAVNWALTVGRILIITVEIIALTAFLYRFILDNQLREINAKINQEQAIIQSQQKNEETYRNLQDRLSVIANLSPQGKENTKLFKDIISFAPLGMTFSNVTLADNAMRIEANVSSVFPLSVFINSLKQYPNTQSVSIDKIENKTSAAFITISISVDFKQKGGINAAAGTK